MQHCLLGSPQQPYRLSDFDFFLPSQLIAQYPTKERTASRLLDGRQLPPTDRIFKDLPSLVQPGDLLVFNNTQVIKARLFGHKATGGRLEILVERVLQNHEVWCHLRSSKSPKPGTWLRLADAFDAEVLGRCGPDNSLFHLRFENDPYALLDTYGHVPLPPYITHADDAEDTRRYQTVVAKHPGAVAAPTAALHFDEAMLQTLTQQGIGHAEVTLHVGAGTFQPIRTDTLSEHIMHSEWFNVPQVTVDKINTTRAQGGRIISVGTTTLRALEAAAASAELGYLLTAGSQETNIFITPGFSFKVVDTLITNFHLPKSTLMMLVSAFAGFSHIKSLYQTAIDRQYRFFSYGDAMVLDKSNTPYA